MSTVTNIRAVAPALPEIVGYVEACTADRLLGWAWKPAEPALHVTIELRLGDEVIATSVADVLRPDLAGNGIGDGRHAYEIAIPADYRTRSAELRVYARPAGGEATPIGAPPAADSLSDQVSRMSRGVEMMLNSQRVIHRNLQAALTAGKDGEATSSVTLERIAELQSATATQLSAVEQFVVRLDEQLSKLVRGDMGNTTVGRSMPWMAACALGLASIALIVSIAGLIHSLGG